MCMSTTLAAMLCSTYSGHADLSSTRNLVLYITVLCFTVLECPVPTLPFFLSLIPRFLQSKAMKTKIDSHDFIPILASMAAWSSVKGAWCRLPIYCVEQYCIKKILRAVSRSPWCLYVAHGEPGDGGGVAIWVRFAVVGAGAVSQAMTRW